MAQPHPLGWVPTLRNALLAYKAGRKEEASMQLAKVKNELAERQLKAQEEKIDILKKQNALAAKRVRYLKTTNGIYDTEKGEFIPVPQEAITPTARVQEFQYFSGLPTEQQQLWLQLYGRRQLQETAPPTEQRLFEFYTQLSPEGKQQWKEFQAKQKTEPSAVREFQFYQSLSPKDRKLYQEFTQKVSAEGIAKPIVRTIGNKLYQYDPVAGEWKIAAEAGGKTIFRNIPNQGLAKINPDGTVEIVMPYTTALDKAREKFDLILNDVFGEGGSSDPEIFARQIEQEAQNFADRGEMETARWLVNEGNRYLEAIGKSEEGFIRKRKIRVEMPRATTGTVPRRKTPGHTPLPKRESTSPEMTVDQAWEELLRE